MATVLHEAEVPAGMGPGQTFTVQTASGQATVTVPQNHVPGQKIQFSMPAAPPVVMAPAPMMMVDPRCMPDPMPWIQFIFIGSFIIWPIGVFGSWIGACANLCCTKNPTERDRQAMWYTNVIAVINIFHFIASVVCMVIFFGLTADAVESNLGLNIAVWLNGLVYLIDNVVFLLMCVYRDSQLASKQMVERASAAPAPAIAPAVVGVPVSGSAEGAAGKMV
mmetsp:Transcript_148216/g.261419  ORF Transcript_148216/g.261419 Transcript_148216/m.261419 type:complete len:221 (+) Transcript_148216:76-738(+)